jgi:hypothetical protein
MLPGVTPLGLADAESRIYFAITPALDDDRESANPKNGPQYTFFHLLHFAIYNDV